jgi:hypothetical protein
MMNLSRSLRRCASPLAMVMAVATLAAFSAVGLSGQEYGVSVKVTQPEALAKARTYKYERGYKAFDKAVDAQIQTAIDRELAARGFTKVESGATDVLATYYSLTRLDSNLKPGADGQLELYKVGTLVIDLLDAANREPLFRVRIDKPLDADRAKLEATINGAVAAMFQKYPTPKAK